MSVSDDPQSAPISPQSPPVVVAITGTDTGVGKSYVTALLIQGLRTTGRQVWIHKPIACGGWDQGQAEDARFLQHLCGDGQLAASVCPLQFPEPASPHLAADAAQKIITMDMLISGINDCRSSSNQHHDLIIEGVGGLLVPVTKKRDTIADVFVAAHIPLLIVTRPHLGTLNHTALTVQVAQQRGLRVLGLILNYHEPVADSLAVRSALSELPLVTGIPVLATLPYRPHTSDAGAADQLAAAVLAATVGATRVTT